MFRWSRVVALLLFATAFLAAQTPDSASIRGQVVDQSHAAVTGAEITAINSLLGWKRSAHSDASGNFSFSGLPVGIYSLLVHQDKFADLHRELTLMGGATISRRSWKRILPWAASACT